MEIFKSILIGVSIAAIPGPIFFQLLRRTLSSGLRSGLFLVFGEFAGNLSLLLLIFLGLTPLLEHSLVRVTLGLIGAGILFYLSYDAIKLSEKDIQNSYDKESDPDKRTSFVVGLSIAVSSPIVIALWVSLSSSYLQHFSSTLLSSVNALAIASGFLVFFCPLAYVVHNTRHLIQPRTVIILSKTFGIILFGFGLWSLWQLSKI